MITLEENERKYLVSDVSKKGLWDKEQIVYQWYVCVEENGHTKIKIAFDILKARIIYAEIMKNTISIGRNSKQVKYLDIRDFSPNFMVGLPFVLKRRSISGRIFLDKMLESNGFCDYLLEDEANELSDYHGGEFNILRDVTDDLRYYNKNLCRIFTNDDAIFLGKLLRIF